MSADESPSPTVVVRELGSEGYEPVWRRMQSFTGARTADTEDEIWLVEHPPVYTQGLSCSQQTLAASSIPIVATDRGGQMTYHGPGQIVVYTLIDLRRAGRGIKWMITLLEQTIIDLLGERDVAGGRKDGAPGVYVDGAKIAALGLRVRRGACYHGLSVNVDMDLSPFSNIDPCGYAGLKVTQFKDFGLTMTPLEVGREIAQRVITKLARR